MKRFLLAVACFAVASNPAMARGGTNMHEMASSRHDDDQSMEGNVFAGCGCGRLSRFTYPKMRRLRLFMRSY